MTETQLDHTIRRPLAAPQVPIHRRSGRQTALILAHDLPGPMSMRMLCDLGIAIPLESTTAFLSSDAQTLYGRASIASALVPTGAAACASLAAWIWSGGPFPQTIDIISRSHYRAPVHGHLIRVFNRSIPPDHLRRLGTLLATSPIRTACDLACGDDHHLHQDVKLTVVELLHRYQLTPSSCLGLLALNPRWPGHARGVRIFNDMKLDFDTQNHHG